MHIDCKEDYYYQESKRLRHEVLQQAEALKGNPCSSLKMNKEELRFNGSLARATGAPILNGV